MKYHFKKIVLAGILILILSCFSAWTGKHSKADHENLKVLPKNISSDSLLMLMDEYCESLKVACGYCHAPAGNDSTDLYYASDANPKKEISRTMILMTMEMNRSYMSKIPQKNLQKIKIVSCNTCHRGKAVPDQ